MSKTTQTDIGDGVTLIKCEGREVRIAANDRETWGAAASMRGCASGAFCGKNYKTFAGAVRAAAKWCAQ